MRAGRKRAVPGRMRPPGGNWGSPSGSWSSPPPTGPGRGGAAGRDSAGRGHRASRARRRAARAGKAGSARENRAASRLCTQVPQGVQAPGLEGRRPPAQGLLAEMGGQQGRARRRGRRPGPARSRVTGGPVPGEGPARGVAPAGGPSSRNRRRAAQARAASGMKQQGGPCPGEGHEGQEILLAAPDPHPGRAVGHGAGHGDAQSSGVMRPSPRSMGWTTAGPGAQGLHGERASPGHP